MHIIILGITGCGASTLCNSLVKDNLFKAHDDISTCTTTFQYETIEHNSESIIVVDCPQYVAEGLLDLEVRERGIVQYLDRLNQEFQHLNSSEKFFVFVRPTGFISQSERDIIKRLDQEIIGESRYCVIINKDFKDKMIRYGNDNSDALDTIYGKHETFCIDSLDIEEFRDVPFFNEQCERFLDYALDLRFTIYS